MQKFVSIDLRKQKKKKRRKKIISFYDCLRLSVNQNSMRSSTLINLQEHTCFSCFFVLHCCASFRIKYKEKILPSYCLCLHIDTHTHILYPVSRIHQKRNQSKLLADLHKSRLNMTRQKRSDR
jgi:hypothetical protein